MKLVNKVVVIIIIIIIIINYTVSIPLLKHGLTIFSVEARNMST